MSALRNVFWTLTALFFLPAALLADPPATTKAEAPKKAEPAKKAEAKFVRITHDKDKQPLALETAVVRFVPASGKGELTVDLVGVVHVGDKDYYEQLNKLLEGYDVVLYELVAPKGTRVPKGGKKDSTNPLAVIQKIVKTMLKLELQLEKVDYTKKNFVHADLSPDEMADAMHKRGENAVTLALGIAADVLRQQNLMELNARKKKGGDDLDPLSLLFDPQAAVKLKRAMARQLAALEGSEGGLGQTLNNLLIVDRNKAALGVLKKELANGKKKIAIFYGAGHMPDFEQRLQADFDLRRQGTRWLKAWDLRPTEGAGVFDLLKSLDK
jgi:hypothetical protein